MASYWLGDVLSKVFGLSPRKSVLSLSIFFFFAFSLFFDNFSFVIQGKYFATTEGFAVEFRIRLDFDSFYLFFIHISYFCLLLGCFGDFLFFLSRIFRHLRFFKRAGEKL